MFRLCAGCGAPIIARFVLKAIEGPKVVVNATGCLEVATTIFPYTSWKVPWVHSAFENAASTASGIEAAFRILEKKKGKKSPKVIVFGGDGGTFDIGLQALSGALERGHDLIYICYDNEAYMNTGIQRSSATPKGASTTTSPAGKVIPGKLERKKDLIGIAVAHGIKYAATANPAYPIDLFNKIRKAASVKGPTVIHYFTPCPTGWRADPSRSIEIARLAVQTRVWPLYECDNGVWKLNVNVKKPKPVEEYLRLQGRFRHLLKPENRWLLEEIKRDIEANWERILKLTGLS
ncbi:MAG: pyruvate ferredoxin oxidoreductase [Thermofilum sp. ex4484_82]|nr:MAG: pyruvate ferredoxin oxidoreductase [Thermofilum sp. ex4484_82]OYT36145.1 MAG: pyruvate ferredoxin oxidoreductase [Archaeoglobales archaeon ex4484_92]